MRNDVQRADRLRRAHASLEGLSIGDAFGNRFFTSPSSVERLIELRALPAGEWNYTDDTVMAISIVALAWRRRAARLMVC
jgi:hypothetical protein